MRLQTLLHGGPYDMDMVVVESVGGEWPPEIRVASGDPASPGEVEAAVYIQTSEAEEQIPGVWLGSYRFVGERMSARTLVTVWN